jgi:hypothetical protein
VSASRNEATQTKPAAWIGDKPVTVEEFHPYRETGALPERYRNGTAVEAAKPEPAKKPGTPGRWRAKATKGPRIFWRYAPVPVPVIDDRELSSNAVRIAAIVARSVNLGPWNTDLHATLTHAELAEKAGISLRSAARALAELKAAGYVEVESLNRGGCRITFTA